MSSDGRMDKENVVRIYYIYYGILCYAVLTRSVVSNSFWPHGLIACQAPLSLGILQARILEWVAIPFSRGSSNPGIEPRSPVLQVDSLPAKPPGKPKNTGVGNLCLLQGNFLIQELNWGVLHCRRILYQLSYQESPSLKYWILKKWYRWTYLQNRNRGIYVEKKIYGYQRGRVNRDKLGDCIYFDIYTLLCIRQLSDMYKTNN